MLCCFRKMSCVLCKEGVSKVAQPYKLKKTTYFVGDNGWVYEK
jgi:hypothetical protein